MSLHHSSVDELSWSRRRCGRGFTFQDATGCTIDGARRQRLLDLAIPPAWTDVRICPDPDAHLQAVGTDEAGRRQYLYHPQWTAQRQAENFNHIQTFARSLGRARVRVQRTLQAQTTTEEGVCALAFELLDRGCFRIGNDAYADENGAFGLTTLRPEHVNGHDTTLVFDYPGKSGVRRHIQLDSPAGAAMIQQLKLRDAPPEQLLAFMRDGTWLPLDSTSVNTYIQAVTRTCATAKDFRTWHATVAAAAALALAAEEAPERKPATYAAEVTAELLGNTPAQARNSYIDPRIIDHHAAGQQVPRWLAQRAQAVWPLRRLELAVLHLLEA